MNYPQINPTIIRLGFLQIRWYGFFYILSFILGYIFLKKFLHYRNFKLSREKYDNLLFNIMLGVIIGGRLGYVLFYNLPYYLTNPLHILAVWEGGMSFHGGAFAVIIIGYLFCKKNNISFYQMADPVMPLVSIGLGLGRLGNFINGELYGIPGKAPWVMIFPNSDGLPRHPSQLYEAFLEGVLLFFISLILLKKIKKHGLVFWAWIGLYGLFRFIVEFYREPDAHLGYIWGFLTMGQILSLTMIIGGLAGVILLILPRNRGQHE
ncbi:MAG: prolipoprotein diacylglyceryl transferase [Candidatus Cloacimonetes bacterium]|nr:prolipoprotein diacylglyceryl transferase [Candidatus Cloacimonadota bacterium]